jgi:hypothetical protein
MISCNMEGIYSDLKGHRTEVLMHTIVRRQSYIAGILTEFMCDNDAYILQYYVINVRHS